MKNYLPTILVIAVSGFMLSSTIYADERYGVVKDKLTLEECGACHMAFQPQLLPERSWRALMTDLEDHFGEDASLDAVSVNNIMGYLINDAADNQWSGSKMLRGLSNNKTPLRISELPYWVREHNEEVSKRGRG